MKLIYPYSTSVKLGEAYYNQGFFNLGVRFSDLLGVDNEPIAVRLGSKPHAEVIFGHINRSANVNQTPRLMLGVPYREWVQQHFRQGDQMTVTIWSAHALELHAD